MKTQKEINQRMKDLRDMAINNFLSCSDFIYIEWLTEEEIKEFNKLEDLETN